MKTFVSDVLTSTGNWSALISAEVVDAVELMTRDGRSLACLAPYYNRSQSLVTVFGKHCYKCHILRHDSINTVVMCY